MRVIKSYLLFKCFDLKNFMNFIIKKGAYCLIDRAIQIKPGYAFLYDSKGEYFMLVGDRKNVLKMYKKVMKLEPTFYISYPNTVLYDYVNKK